MGLSSAHQGLDASTIATSTVEPRDSARSSLELPDAFHRLVMEINHILGPSNGIDSEDVGVEELKGAMLDYSGQDVEWQKYAFADPSRAYTRNLVDKGNGKSNLLILVWSPGKSSPIHDHANAHCVMRVLKGSLTETLYEWPCQSKDALPEYDTSSRSTDSDGDGCEGRKPHRLAVKHTTIFDQGQVTYMSDQLGLHRVGNPSKSEVAVSLHLYTPPNAAKYGCHIFDEQSGRKYKVEQHHFFSELGKRTE